MNSLYLAIWGAGALGVPALALYRKWIASGEEGSLCLLGDGSAIEKQKFISGRLEAIDRWGKALTWMVTALGLILLAVYVYVRWETGLKTPY
jgi:hypothetical protein